MKCVFVSISIKLWKSNMIIWNKLFNFIQTSLREKCPNTEFFRVRIFPHSGWIRRDTDFSPNARKYRPEKTPYLDLFHAVFFASNTGSWIDIFYFEFCIFFTGRMTPFLTIFSTLLSWKRFWENFSKNEGVSLKTKVYLWYQCFHWHWYMQTVIWL